MPWDFSIAPADVDAPALTCHLAFLKPFGSKDKAAERREEINTLLDAINNKYRVQLKHLERNNPVSNCKVRWCDVPVTLVFHMTSEIVSFRIYIHADGTVDLPKPTSARRKILRHAILYSREIMDIAADPSRERNLRAIHKLMFEDLWVIFFEANKELPGPDPKWKGIIGVLKNPRVIVDWRGLIVSRPPILAPSQIVDRLKRFQCCRGTTERPLNVRDFSISTWKGKRFIHVSTMGPPLEGKSFYILLCPPSSHGAELGELMLSEIERCFTALPL